MADSENLSIIWKRQNFIAIRPQTSRPLISRTATRKTASIWKNFHRKSVVRKATLCYVATLRAQVSAVSRRTSLPCVLARPRSSVCVWFYATRACMRAHVRHKRVVRLRSAPLWWGGASSWHATAVPRDQLLERAGRLHAHLFASLFRSSAFLHRTALWSCGGCAPRRAKAAAPPRRQLPVKTHQNRIVLVRVLPPHHPLRPHVSPNARYEIRKRTLIHKKIP